MHKTLFSGSTSHKTFFHFLYSSLYLPIQRTATSKFRLTSFFPSVSSVQSLSRVRLFVTPRTAPRQASLSIINSRSLLKLTSFESVISSISSSVVPFSSSLQSFPASGSFQRSQLFASGGQNVGVSASASVLPMNIQD